MVWFECRSDVTEWNLITRASECPLGTTVDNCLRFDNLNESLRTRTLQSQVLRFNTEDDFRSTTTAVLRIINLFSFPIQLTWYSRGFSFCLFIIYAHLFTGSFHGNCSLGYHHVVFFVMKTNVQAKSVCWSNSVWGFRKDPVFSKLPSIPEQDRLMFDHFVQTGTGSINPLISCFSA